MKQKLCRRLEEVEKASAAATAVRRVVESTDSPALIALKAKVEEMRADPERMAWAAAQPPEWLGIQVRKLREALMEIASGHRRGVVV